MLKLHHPMRAMHMRRPHPVFTTANARFLPRTGKCHYPKEKSFKKEPVWLFCPLNCPAAEETQQARGIFVIIFNNLLRFNGSLGHLWH